MKLPLWHPNKKGHIFGGILRKRYLQLERPLKTYPVRNKTNVGDGKEHKKANTISWSCNSVHKKNEMKKNIKIISQLTLPLETMTSPLFLYFNKHVINF